MTSFLLALETSTSHTSDPFMWLINKVGEGNAWLLVLNTLISLIMGVWFYRQAAGEERSRWFWTLYGPLWGMLTTFITPMLAMQVKRQYEERKESGTGWFVLVSLLSLPAFYAGRVMADAHDRRLSAGSTVLLGILGGVTCVWLVGFPLYLIIQHKWLTAHFVAGQLLLILSLPFLAVLPMLLFHFLYHGLRPRLTIEYVRRRFAESGDLRPVEGQLMAIEDLVKYFPVRRGTFGTTGAVVKAVDGVNLTLKAGSTLGLVGESGCGKTTLGRLALGLLKPTRGSVLFDGMDIEKLSAPEMRAVREKMQLVFQDPFGSLNPRMTVETIVGEALTIHGIARGRARRERVEELLERVGLAREHLRRYPHEFSGGQRQRIGIARALALNPSFIVCDEPVSALDVSIQAQILNLLADLRDEFGLTYLFIAHDLSVVEHISDEVAVMYLGKVVERAPSVDLYRSPMHPYTMALLSSIPVPDPLAPRRRIVLSGDVPTPINPPQGCSFHPRCRYAIPDCRLGVPSLRELAHDHVAACIRAEEIQRDPVATITNGITVQEA